MHGSDLFPSPGCRGRRLIDLLIEGIQGELCRVVGAAESGHVAPHHAGIGLAIILAVPLSVLFHNLGKNTSMMVVISSFVLFFASKPATLMMYVMHQRSGHDAKDSSQSLTDDVSDQLGKEHKLFLILMLMAERACSLLDMQRHAYLAVVIGAGLVVHALLRFDVGHSAYGVVVLWLGIGAGHVCWALHQLLQGHSLL